MFERYNEQARRALFFSRYESSQLGSMTIETEHLLLGIAREVTGVTGRLLALSQVTPERIRTDLEAQIPRRPEVSTSVEIPFSAEMTHVLKGAASEADGLHHAYIGTEHLLLGILRDEASVAGALLKGYGMTIADTRTALTQLLGEGGNETWVGSTLNVSAEIDRLAQLALALANAQPGSTEAAGLMTEFHVVLGHLRGSIQP